MKYSRAKMVIRLLTCLMLLAAVAIQRNDSLFGHNFSKAPSEKTTADAALEKTPDGVIINSTSIAKDIKGYGGSTPMLITVKDGKIAEIKPLKNAETPEFFELIEQEVLPKWIDVSVDSVAATTVDAVTGATMSSNAANATVKAAIAYAANDSSGIFHQKSKSALSEILSVKSIAALLVILPAMILPLFNRNKRYRILQLIINVIVLGFWCGTFLSYSLFINYLANGFSLLTALPWLLMIVAAFIYPYFGKKSYYCTWICPFGSIQELAGHSVKYKLKLSPKTVKTLSLFQEWLWVILMFIMCAGIYSSWIDYEPFTAFLFRQANIGVLIFAGAFVLLSFVVNRPYCRFVCPTGCLFQFSQNIDK